MSTRTPPPATAADVGAHAGQALVEYLLVIGVIALLCIPGFAFLQGGIARAYGAQSAGLNVPPIGTTTAAAPAPTATATPGAAYVLPADANACKNGGWQTFFTPAGTFKNQGDCVSWVATNGRNAPALTPTP